MIKISKSDSQFIKQLKSIVLDSKNKIVHSVNSVMTLTYWEIGHKINVEILQDGRAQYGKEIIATVSRELKGEFGRGFEEKNLRRMIQFATVIEKEKVVTLSRELSWSHFLVVLPLNDELQRDFYLEICKNERWSVRVFRDRVNSMLYERTSLSKKPDELIKYEIQELQNKKLNEDMILKDPYLLDFLDIKDRFLEKDLEDAILRKLEEFMLELGNGFTFVARQKRIQIDSDDFYIDLLFYNRKLKKLIAIDLKIGEFKAEYKGQMELYLRWLEKHEKQDDENSPIGIILCTGKKDEQVELLGLEKSGIHVAEYLTVLPPKEILQQKLSQAIKFAKESFGNK